MIEQFQDRPLSVIEQTIFLFINILNVNEIIAHVIQTEEAVPEGIEFCFTMRKSKFQSQVKISVDYNVPKQNTEQEN